MLQWQHGSYQKLADGSLILTPIKEDGRQLMSDPCHSSSSVYTRYNQTETFQVCNLFLNRIRGIPNRKQRYEYLIDPYHKIPRLNLYQFDGSPLPPMYIAYKPPQMLPTTTLHPATTATGAAAKATGKIKRSLRLLPKAPGSPSSTWIDADRWWWFGVSLTGVGGFLYFCV
jgi:hypothetical protein